MLGRVSLKNFFLPLAGAIALLSSAVNAEPIFPAGAHPVLDETMTRHARQFYEINARSLGLSLDAHVLDPERVTVDQFLAQTASDDFVAVTGKHPFEILSRYGEHGDLGFFGGVALAATAFEYLTLKRDGGSASDLARARARVVRAAESWHVHYVVAGGGGLVARGIRRRVPEDPADPPLPGTIPMLTPLSDGNGNPLPPVKNNGTWRDDNSGGELPPNTWVFDDSLSKDQLVGQVFGMTLLYDAMKGDPDIEQALVTRLEEDARGVGEMLMSKRDIAALGLAGSGEYDLIIMDADGRPTIFHDLNPLSLQKVYVTEESGAYDLFNTVMALGVIKGLHHVSGDTRLEQFLYEELHVNRDFLGKITDYGDSLDYIYRGINTNTDNPDMSAVALWLALYTEKDPAVSAVIREFLETGWWDRAGESYTAKLSDQPLWHAVYLTLSDRGTDPALVAEIADLLEGFTLGPYWNLERINCDAAEIAARQCVAIDGTTIIDIAGIDVDGDPIATEALHPSIRPNSNFNARSSSFFVNGGGNDRLNPGGDLLASYWIMRFMQTTAPGETNLSPNARDRTPPGAGGTSGSGGSSGSSGTGGAVGMAGNPSGGSAGAAGNGASSSGSGGCGCRAAGSASSRAWMLVLAVAALAGARRRRHAT